MTTRKIFTRRNLFGLTWAFALGALALQIGSALLKFMTPALEQGTFGTQIYAGKISEFPAGSVTYFREGRFYLVRLQDGFLALYRRCTHLGCVAPWNEVEGVFNCPCHSAVFTRQGTVISGPAPRPLDLFPVDIRGDEIYVDTGIVIQRETYNTSQITPA